MPRSSKLRISPAGSNCFSSKVFSNSIPVSEELVLATGRQMFDPKASDRPFVLNPNVKHQSRQRTSGTQPSKRQRSFCAGVGRVFQKVQLACVCVCICSCICSWWGNENACDSWKLILVHQSLCLFLWSHLSTHSPNIVYVSSNTYTKTNTRTTQQETADLGHFLRWKRRSGEEKRELLLISLQDDKDQSLCNTLTHTLAGMWPQGSGRGSQDPRC